MELLVAAAIGVMTAGGIYLVLRQRTFPAILGVALLSLSLIHISEPTRLESKSRFPSSA